MIMDRRVAINTSRSPLSKRVDFVIIVSIVQHSAYDFAEQSGTVREPIVTVRIYNGTADWHSGRRQGDHP
jgi:hypothetical protein